MAELPLPSDDQLPDEIRTVLEQLPPLNVFRAFAGVPKSFRPLMELGGSLLGAPEIDAKNREIAILSVAAATGAGYEWAQHEKLAANVGVSEAEIESIREGNAEALDGDGKLAHRVATEISHDVRLSDDGLEALIERWGNAGAAELILTAGYYNMVSRFLESARVPLEAETVLGDQKPGEIGRDVE